jgi:hypothetical protein
VTDPDRPRPVPGPSAPVPAGGAAADAAGGPAGEAAPAQGPAPFQDLAERPVAEHVGVFEAEHDRLRRELSTIDQL